MIESYPANEAFDLATVYHTLSVEKRLHGYEVFKRFYEIGSPDGLREADAFFRMGGET